MASNKFKFVYLDQYDAEFRRGYDVANVVNIMKELLKAFYTENSVRKMYVNIHKDSVSVCEGVCAENLFHTGIKDPEKAEQYSKADDEVWMMITPSKMIKR